MATTKYLAKFQSPRAITWPKIIGPEQNVNLICTLSLYTHIPNIKSISQSIAKKSGDNYFISELRNDGHQQHYMSQPLSGGDIKIQLSVLVEYKAIIFIISSKCNLFSQWYSWENADWALNYNHSLTYKQILNGHSALQSTTIM